MRHLFMYNGVFRIKYEKKETKQKKIHYQLQPQ